MRRGRARVLGQQADFLAGHYRIRSRFGERVEISISGAEEWRGRLSDTLFRYVVRGRDTHLLSGVSHRAKTEEGRHWGMESSLAVLSR